MTILVVGGDSLPAMTRRSTACRQGHVEHWSGRKPRDLAKSIPKDTDAVVIVLDRISHALARAIKKQAGSRGLPVFFQRRRQRPPFTTHHPADLRQLFG